MQDSVNDGYEDGGQQQDAVRTGWQPVPCLSFSQKRVIQIVCRESLLAHQLQAEERKSC